jgi:hypothetical protein
MELKSLITCPDHHSLDQPRRSNWTYNPRTGSKFTGVRVLVGVGEIGVLVSSGNEFEVVADCCGMELLQPHKSKTINIIEALKLKKVFISPPKVLPMQHEVESLIDFD